MLEDAHVRSWRECGFAFVRDISSGRARSHVRGPSGDDRQRGPAVVLHRADEARRLLESLPGDEASRALKTRVEVLSATAQVALGDEDAARKSFTRALASDPELQLDPMITSPKVMQALNDARGEGGS